MIDVIDSVAHVLSWVLVVAACGGGIVGVLTIVLWAGSNLGSKVVFYLWSWELTILTARHLWYATRITPPDGRSPMDPEYVTRTARRLEGEGCERPPTPAERFMAVALVESLRAVKPHHVAAEDEE